MKAFLLSLSLLLSATVFAVTDTVSQKKTGGQIAAGLTFTVQGSRYAVSAVTPDVTKRNYSTQKVTGLIKLSCPQALTFSPRPSGDATVAITVDYLVEDKVKGTFTSRSASKTLKISFSSAAVTDVSYLKLDDAQSVTVKVVSAGTSIPASFPPLELEGAVITESYTFLSANTSISLNAPGLTTEGNLRVSWNDVTGAEYYQLEWTYVSDQDPGDITKRKDPANIEVDPYLFRTNSSRAEVRGKTYDIPMIYEKGIILYRVRALGKTVVNSVLTDVVLDWTSPDGSFNRVSSYSPNSRFVYDGLEENLNWNASISYAEEGKNKVLTSYNDGSLRQRQAITRINSDQRSVVGETLYDYQGRPAVSLLPAPVKENTITFFPGFNIPDQKSQVDKADYDAGGEGIRCTVKAPLFSTSTGASHYYSPANSFGTAGNKGPNLLNRNLIPDAGKYPYTQTLYTPDNTGRISVQSGVGSGYNLGSGKETRYFYGSPQQTELGRLFGRQAGFAGHYKKNTIVDPNGQTTVSYLNMEGKVVAATLAGDKPANLNPLGTTSPRTIKTDLLSSGAVSNKISPDGLSKVYTSKWIVTGANTAYKFNYTAIIGHYDLTCALPGAGNPLNLKLDGAVDAEVVLTDPCGAAVFNSTSSTVAGTTGNNQTITVAQDKTLQTGEYQLSKTLKINEEKLEQYWQNYLKEDRRCVLKEEDFVDQAIGNINLVGCGLTCESCQAEVNRLLGPGNTYTPEESARIRNLCNSLCDETIGCLSSLEAMKGDMSPGGQYAQLRKEKITQTGIQDARLDENNQPVVTDISITLNNNDGTGFDKGDPADNQIDPYPYPLSIFNDFNSLRVHEILQGVITDHKVTWTRPLKINSSSFTGDNRMNQVLYSGVNLRSGVTYSETDYTDRNGNVFYVNIYKSLNPGPNANPYTPHISDDTKLIEVNKEIGLYKIAVKYLASLEDFEKYWQPHWANYLIPYHPEYEYFLDCTGEVESNNFDFKLTNIQTVLDARSKGLIDAAGNPLIVGTARSASLDPYISNSDPNYKYIKLRNDSYKQFIINGSNAMRTMAQIATISTGCPRGETSCGIPSCLDGKIDTDDEWNAYKGLYLSEKETLRRTRARIKAVDRNYYNGCIGNASYLTDPEAEYFRRPIIKTTAVTKTIEKCFKSWIDILTFSWTCNPFTFVTYTKSTTYPYLNPDQLCYRDFAGLYEKKAKRFFLHSPSKEGGGQPAEHCITFADNEDPTQNPVEIDIPCDEDVQEALNLATERAQRFKYMECGQCPLAADLEQLLVNLGKNNLLVSSNQLLTCENGQFKVTLGEVLRRELLALNGGISNVTWTATTASAGKVLNGSFRTGTSVIATISLTIPVAVPVTFSTLKDLCCLGVDLISSGSQGKWFSIHSFYKDVQGHKNEFAIAGQFSIALAPCTIAPRCLLTDDAQRVAFFLNVLSAFETNIPDKKHDLDSKNLAVDLLKTEVKDYYTLPVRSMLKKDNMNVLNGYVENLAPFSPQWKSSVNASNKLSGMLSYTENSIARNVVIEVSGLPAGFQYSQIKEFQRVRPEPVDMASTDPCRNAICDKETFLADVLIPTPTGKKYFTVKIYVPAWKPVTCRPAIPAQN